MLLSVRLANVCFLANKIEAVLFLARRNPDLYHSTLTSPAFHWNPAQKTHLGQNIPGITASPSRQPNRALERTKGATFASLFINEDNVLLVKQPADQHRLQESTLLLQVQHHPSWLLSACTNNPSLPPHIQAPLWPPGCTVVLYLCAVLETEDQKGSRTSWHLTFLPERLCWPVGSTDLSVIPKKSSLQTLTSVLMKSNAEPPGGHRRTTGLPAVSPSTCEWMAAFHHGKTEQRESSGSARSVPEQD